VVKPSTYECGDLASEAVTPELGQIFCIGNGRSTATGQRVSVSVPDEATVVYLGVADRLSPLAPPGFFGDNSGTWLAEVWID